MAGQGTMPILTTGKSYECVQAATQQSVIPSVCPLGVFLYPVPGVSYERVYLMNPSAYTPSRNSEPGTDS